MGYDTVKFDWLLLMFSEESAAAIIRVRLGYDTV
jgi:hypothetical protein